MSPMSRHGPFSAYELTAENKSPSLFYSLARQEAVPAAVQGPGDPRMEVTGGQGLESWRWRSHGSMEAAVIPSFRKSQNSQKDRSAGDRLTLNGIAGTAFDS